ncbi:unknown [Prevotella sp. CAG:487]|nr:unknown [Prevotella sp. CAG:487]
MSVARKQVSDAKAVPLPVAKSVWQHSRRGPDTAMTGSADVSDCIV